MFALLKQTRTGVSIAMIGLILMSAVAPVLALADSDLVPGDDAVVSDDTNLFSDASLDATIKAEVSEDTPISILEGPLADANGEDWYLVRVWDISGYIPADDIDGVATESDEPTEAPVEDTTDAETESTEESAPALPWTEPIDFGVAYDNVTCRADTSTSATELTVVPAGQTVEITGAEVWAEGIGWTPVNCAGVGGYISSDFIGSGAEATEEVVEESPVEVTVIATEEVVEEPQVEETAVATEEVVESVPAGPWQQPIAAGVATSDVTCRVDASTASAAITVFFAGQAVEITGAEVWAEGIGWTPVNCDGVGGFAATQYLSTGTSAEETEEATETATETETVVATETATATETVVATETETVTETEVATETATATATETATATQTVTATETATETAVETEEPDATETATEVPTDETEATSEPTEVDDETPVATDEATETPAEEVTETPVVESDSSQKVEETESTSPVDDSAIIGTAEVRGTNGDGVACRTAPSSDAPVIGVLPEGMNLFVLSTPDADGWMSIVCNNEVGYAQSSYLYSGGAASEFTSSGSSFGNVTGTGGGGLNCRSNPSINASIVGYFPAGSGVNVRGAAQGSWVPVVCGGSNGWVHGDYLTATGGNSNNNDSTDGILDGIVDAISGTATVTGTNGDGLRCRTSANGSVLMVMGEGMRVSVRGSAEGAWLPIVCGGMNGYAHTSYLTMAGSGDSGNNGGGGDTGNNNGGSDPGTVTVTGTGGASLNCRSGAGTGYNVLTSVRPGSVLSTRGASSNGWQPVTCNGMSGWVSSMYVTAGGSSDGGGNTPTPTPEPEPEPSGLANGDHAKVNSNLNLRYEPSMGAGVATYAPAGTVVLITGGHAGNGYYPVNWDGLKGYMHGDYMTETSEALSKRGGSGNPTTPPTSGGGGGSATGNAIVDYAMGYLGYPYVWATHGPYSFDCSGFTGWVIQNVVGKNIGYGLWTQVSAGTPVSKSNLQPGDLVFFQNTYKAGLSHVGIYIGGGQFIHAQNESTGVVISDLDSNYYGSRWYGAVRIG